MEEVGRKQRKGENDVIISELKKNFFKVVGRK